MLKIGNFCKMVILVVFKVSLVVKNLENLALIVPDVSIYPYSPHSALPLPFLAKIFRPPTFPSILKKSNPPLYKGGGGGGEL